MEVVASFYLTVSDTVRKEVMLQCYYEKVLFDLRCKWTYCRRPL